MHWVIQKNIFKPINYQILVDSLRQQNINYTTTKIPPKTFDLVPDVKGLENVYVCGAIKMAKIAKEKNWYPGSFLNENYNFSIWLSRLGDELLNFDCKIDKLINIDPQNYQKFFIRPAEDNKAFDGMIMDRDMLLAWSQSETKKSLHNLNVIISPLKQIYQEYRFFIVDRDIVTASLYKMDNKPTLSSIIPEEIANYVKSIIDKWLPSSSVVIDIALTDKGLKVIEFNNINSSGFYAINVPKYVAAIQQSYNKE